MEYSLGRGQTKHAERMPRRGAITCGTLEGGERGNLPCDESGHLMSLGCEATVEHLGHKNNGAIPIKKEGRVRIRKRQQGCDA